MDLYSILNQYQCVGGYKGRFPSKSFALGFSLEQHISFANTVFEVLINSSAPMSTFLNISKISANEATDPLIIIIIMHPHPQGLHIVGFFVGVAW